MELSCHLIEVFTLGIVIDNAAPLISLVLFAVCHSSNNAAWQALKGDVGLDLLAKIEGALRVSVMRAPLIFLLVCASYQ